MINVQPWFDSNALKIAEKIRSIGCKLTIRADRYISKKSGFSDLRELLRSLGMLYFESQNDQLGGLSVRRIHFLETLICHLDRVKQEATIQFGNDLVHAMRHPPERVLSSRYYALQLHDLLERDRLSLEDIGTSYQELDRYLKSATKKLT